MVFVNDPIKMLWSVKSIDFGVSLLANIMSVSCRQMNTTCRAHDDDDDDAAVVVVVAAACDH